MALKLDPTATNEELIQEEMELTEVLSNKENWNDRGYWVWYMMRDMVWNEMRARGMITDEEEE